MVGLSGHHKLDKDWPLRQVTVGQRQRTRISNVASETITIDKDRIVHETIDDEVIIIDLQSGSYFSLRESAAELWPAIVEGTSSDQLTAILATVYDAQPSTVEASVSTFLNQLDEEDIIVVQPGGGSAVDRSTMSDGRQKRAFVPPLLEKYTNMTDMLLLDPIHDVDDQGWPGKKSD